MDELTMQDLRDVFADTAKKKGMKVLGKGHGYSNGTYFDMEAKSPTGLRVYVMIEESRDEEYLTDRYAKGPSLPKTHVRGVFPAGERRPGRRG